MEQMKQIPPFGVRLPEPLKAQLKENAGRNRRSLNSEIVTMLEKAVQETTETKNGSVTA